MLEDIDLSNIEEQERGTAFDYESDVFGGGFENGLVFSYGEANIRDYEDMLDKDGKAAGIEKLLTYPVISAAHHIVGSKGDKGEKEFIQETFDGMETSLEQIIALMTYAFTIRHQFFEKIYDTNEEGNKVIYKDVAWRPPNTCELALDEKTGRYRGFRQNPVTFGNIDTISRDGVWQYFDPRYAFVYTHGMWRNPIEGMSAMRVPYWCFATKQKIRYLWYNFLKTRSLPWVYVKNENDKEARKNARKVATLKSSGVIGLGDKNELGVLESSGRGGDQFMDAMAFLDSEMSHSILGGFMDLTSQAASGKGSYALSQDQSKLFLRTRQFVARDLATQVSKQLIKPLVQHNFGKKAAIPELKFGPLSDSNEAEILELFTRVATTGANVTSEFYSELTSRVAALLELDTQKVERSIEVEGNPLEKMVGTVDKATDMVKEAQGKNQGAFGKEDLNDPNAIKQTRSDVEADQSVTKRQG